MSMQIIGGDICRCRRCLHHSHCLHGLHGTRSHAPPPQTTKDTQGRGQTGAYLQCTIAHCIVSDNLLYYVSHESTVFCGKIERSSRDCSRLERVYEHSLKRNKERRASFQLRFALSVRECFVGSVHVPCRVPSLGLILKQLTNCTSATE